MLTAGFAQAVITPPVGVEISGYAFGPSACVLAELQAQAVVLEWGDMQAVIILAPSDHLSPDTSTASPPNAAN